MNIKCTKLLHLSECGCYHISKSSFVLLSFPITHNLENNGDGDEEKTSMRMQKCCEKLSLNSIVKWYWTDFKLHDNFNEKKNFPSSRVVYANIELNERKKSEKDNFLLFPFMPHTPNQIILQ